MVGFSHTISKSSVESEFTIIRGASRGAKLLEEGSTSIYATGDINQEKLESGEGIEFTQPEETEEENGAEE